MSLKNQSQIYALEGLTPEVKAVTFAKCSRSSESFKEIAKNLTEEKSSKFHEKWVVGYGHGSVAEHATLSIAIENVSLVAVEAIESNRLASYTEKSSRYQIFDENRVYYPQEFNQDKKIKKLYQNTIKEQFILYKKSIEPVKKVIYQIYPKKKNEPEKMYQMRVRSHWIDVCRYLLPNAVLANLGMTANARTFEHALTKWFSHSLKEVRDIATKLKPVALSVTPTLVKYADPNKYLIRVNQELPKKVKTALGSEKKYLNQEKLVELIDYDKKAEEKILAAILYRYSNIPYKKACQRIKKLKVEEKEKLLDYAFKGLKSHDKPLRELEYPYFTFDILIDQGAYADLKRNRIMTQTVQPITTKHGYFIPTAIINAGLEKNYHQIMKQTDQTYRQIAKKFPNLAAYIACKAFARRLLMKMNLRELYYFCYYRGANPGGHFSYRYIGTKIFEIANKLFPRLMKYVPYQFEQNSEDLKKQFKLIEK